jgi:hypothetical protein
MLQGRRRQPAWVPGPTQRRSKNPPAEPVPNPLGLIEVHHDVVGALSSVSPGRQSCAAL